MSGSYAPLSATEAKARLSRGEEGAGTTIVRALRLSPELRIGLGVTLLLALLATAGRAIVPIVIQQTIDRGLGSGAGGVDMPYVLWAVVLAFVAVVATAALSAGMNIRLATSVEHALSNLRVRAFAHIHDLSMLHQASEQRGAMVSRVTTDIDEVSRFMQFGGLNLVTALGQLTVTAVVMLVLSWQLALVVAILVVPFALAARWFQLRLTVATIRVRQRLGELLGRLAEVVVGAPVVRAYGIEERTQRQLDDAIESHRDAAIHMGRYSVGFSATSELFNGAATAAVIVAGTVLAATGQVTVGRVASFLFLVTLFIEPVQMAAETINEGQNAVAGWRRVLDVLDVAPDVADPGEDGVTLPPGPLGITFDDVRFRYPRPGETARDASGPEVLHGIDVTITPQTAVAVVGETGSGKTTFAKLLTRLMDPSSGQVRLGEVPVDRVRFDSLRRRVVMVPQEGALFAGTIADNLRHGREDATDEDLELALLELGLADWLDELPQHLDTPVGERGASLSAGERQLVALARAYLANPDLLVLDEATSAVDPATEVRLQRALSGLTVGRTTVTIAHRLSTAEAADRVLVFDEGRLVQDGPHDRLVAEAGVYAHLHASWQAGTA
jgi:ATP-binding cassette, subfamily B, bacterial